MASAFVDESQIHVKGGNGGAGAVSFRREAHVSRGGPDGGDGGRGGSVYLEATTNLASLLSFVDHPHRRAGDGGHGGGKRRHGRNGADLVVPVPVGTIVRHPNGDVLADLTTSGDRYLAAAGGRGGRGNARFLSNRLRAPAFAEQAELGEEHWLNLELELMADVAARRVPQRRQVDARVEDLRRQAEDRRLSLHDPRAPSRRRPRRWQEPAGPVRRSSSSSPTSPA